MIDAITLYTVFFIDLTVLSLLMSLLIMMMTVVMMTIMMMGMMVMVIMTSLMVVLLFVLVRHHSWSFSCLDFAVCLVNVLFRQEVA